MNRLLIGGGAPGEGMADQIVKSYRYTARDIRGSISKGVIDAESSEDVYQKLKAQNLYCVNLERYQDREVRANREKMKIRDVSLFCRQLSTMLSAGLTVVRALDILYERAKDHRIKDAYLQMYENIQKGLSLYEAMHELGVYFPALMLSMVQAGERSGTLDEVMKKMSEHYEKEYRMISKLRSSMAYPILLVGVTLLVMVGLFVFVLPSFFSMFDGADTPVLTKVVMAISYFMINRWYVLLIGTLVAVVLWMFIRQIPKVRLGIDHLKIKLPLLGKQLRIIYVARFTHALSVLYSSGIPMIDGVEMAVAVLGNSFVTITFSQVLEDISQGEMLSSSLQKTGLFDSMVSSMIYIGEESGSLDQMLVKLSTFYDEESQTALDKLAALLEPCMMVIIAVLIGIVMAAVMLPIYGMYSSVI